MTQESTKPVCDECIQKNKHLVNYTKQNNLLFFQPNKEIGSLKFLKL